MTTRFIYIVLIIFGLTVQVNGQGLMGKVEKLFDSKKNLIEKTVESYNTSGRITKSVITNYRSNVSVTIKDYFYNESGKLAKEIFSGLRSYQDSTGKTYWTDTIIISITNFTYNSKGQIILEKEYSFQCDLDTCDITEFFYEGNLLTKKYCTNDCSMKRLDYNYPIYYKYDSNDSLILKQAREPTDTTKVWYAYSYDYSLFPEKYIYQRFYRKDDSLQLEVRSVIKTEYLKDGKKSRIIYLEWTSAYELFEYDKNGNLSSQISVRNGKPIRELAYKYDKQNNVVRIETYEENKDKNNKLKLDYYQTYDYEYY